MITINDQISEGDQVSIYWENVTGLYDVEVLHVASGPGEVWIVKDRNGKIHYIMTYSRITRAKQGTKDVPDENLTI